MKKRFRKVLAFVLMLTFMISFGQLMNNQSVNAAKAPVLNKASKTIYEQGTTYQLRVKNKPKNAKFAWSSSKESVATVNGQGLVTAKGKGTTNITCKVTYSDNTSIKLTSKITVKITATDVQISNANKVGNAHYLEVGESFDFNRTLTPSNSSDKTYWVIKDENGKETTEFAEVNSAGVVKAIKVGNDNKDVILKLEARTGATKAKAMDPLNAVTDAINLVITGPTAYVTSVKQTESNVVTITFNRPILKSSVIDSKGSLTSAVKVEAKTSSNNVKANDLGTITPSLSADGLTLKLTTQNRWSGLYYINLTSAVTSTNGLSLESYSDDIDLTDNTLPKYVTTTVDGTGMIAYLRFSEEINISGINGKNGLVIQRINTKVDSYTEYIIRNLSNYKLSEDKKTLMVDLSGIVTSDTNKAISIDISGITDLSGNAMSPWIATVYLMTDTTTQPLANLKTITRTSKYTLTAEFDKEIEYAGTLSINNVPRIGEIDTKDKTKVNYTIYNNELTNTTLVVNIANWKSYRANTYGTNTTRSVNMAVGLDVPRLNSAEIVTNTVNGETTYQLLLTYSKNIKLLSTTGSMDVTFEGPNGVIRTIPNIQYTASITADNVVNLLLDKSFYQGKGEYLFKIGDILVYDDYQNFGEPLSFKVKLSTSSDVPYPKPSSIGQNPNKNEIVITFAHMVDLNSAYDVKNYLLNGMNPIGVNVIANDENIAIIVLTFASGTIPYSGEYPVTISNLKGYNNSYKEMDSLTKFVYLTENDPPKFLYAKLYDAVTIQLVFDESSDTLLGTPSFSVIYNGVNVNVINVQRSQNNINLTLSQAVTTSGLYIKPNTSNNVTDAYGNAAVFLPIIDVTY